MLRGIYTAAMGIRQNQNRQDVTANNIANASTTGFKEDRVVTKPFQEVMVQNKDSSASGKVPNAIGTMTFGVEKGDLYTNFSRGPFQNTGQELDFAINGSGFFTVLHSDGTNSSICYTRDGSFQTDADNKLVTGNGNIVLGRNIQDGTLGPIYTSGGKLTVDSEGRVSIDSEYRYDMELTDFDDYNKLDRIGNNLYTVSDTTIVPVTNGEYEVKQGYIEGSNVDITQEMTDMIVNLRSFQANQRVLQSINETLGKTVNEVGALK